MPALNRRDIVRSCKAKGWTIHPIALDGVEKSVRTIDELDNVLELIGSKMNGGRTITSIIWEQVVEEANREFQQDTTALNRKSSFSDLKVINAFNMPKLVYESMRKQFDVQTNCWPLLGNAEDKITMLAQRYALIHQRLLRHELFRRNNLHSRVSGEHKLTPVESLLGKETATDPYLLLAIIVQIEDGQFYLEDPTGQVPVSFKDASAVDGFFVTEHCILLVEGIFLDGIFYAHRLGHPLLESRVDSLQAIQQQLSHPAYALPRKSIANESFVVLSDVHLDRPLVLQQLEGLLSSYENFDECRLPLFILMGNFSGQGHPVAMKQSMEELATTISKFPSLARYAHFVIVPGPLEGQFVLPFPPLQITGVHDKIDHFHLVSNPCRLQWRGQEMVIFRHDIVSLMQQQQILLPSRTLGGYSQDAWNEQEDRRRRPNCRMIKTILGQGHLIPVAGVPIFWHYDHALRLYPLPDVLVLGGDDSAMFHEVFEGVQVVHPGSLARHSSYAVFDSSLDFDELGDMDDDVDTKPSQVTFGYLGTD